MKKLSKKLTKAAQAMHADGKTDQQIAEQLGVEVDAVAEALRPVPKPKATEPREAVVRRAIHPRRRGLRNQLPRRRHCFEPRPRT